MRNASNIKNSAIMCTLFVLSLLCCVDEYNPFQDDANARTHIFRTLFSSDTIPIFTTDSVELLFTVCNLIQKVSLRVSHNRYFDTMTITDICKKSNINVSFYDTGYQELRIATYRVNGDSVVLKRRYYVTSDIKPDTAKGYYGDTLQLHVETINEKQDKDIQYLWKIGSVKPVSSHFDSAVIVIDELVKSDSGQLFIGDNSGKYFSPPFYFNVVLLDPLPEIVIAGIDSDSLYTSSDSIDLWVNIEKCITPVTVYTNGLQMKNIAKNTYYTKINKTDATIQKLTIVAVDDRTGKKSSREVYVEFNSKKQHGAKASLNILEVLTNGVIEANQKADTLSGSVELFTNQAKEYTVSLFDQSKPLGKIKKFANSNFNWDFPVTLNKLQTVFRIELSDTLSNILDDTTVMVNYCNDCVDSNPPIIASVYVNGTPSSSGRFVSQMKDVKIEVICLDDGIIDSVVLNNKLMKRDSSTNVRWNFDTQVNHILSPDTLFLYAVDRKGNRSGTNAIVAGYNTSPVVRTFPDSIEHARTGVMYTRTIEIKDEDINDFVTYSIDSADVRNITIDDKGLIKWTPQRSDAGFNYVNIKGMDRSSYTASCSYVIYVSETALDTVKFVTSRNEFPDMITCTDSISIPLKVRGGTKPFVFEITDRTKNNKKIQVNQVMPYFKWKPDCGSDTGAHQFFIVVRDTLRLSDTLWPVITVLPANREFTLKELKWSGIKKPDSSLDLSRNRTDTLFYMITDPDSPQYERHTIEIASGTEKYTIMTDSGKFFVQLSHTARVSGRDSLVLIVKDRANHASRIVRMLDYGKPPLTATLVHPRNDSLFESKDIAFRWSSSDPDGEVLKYHFTLQFIDGSYQFEKEIKDTFCTVTGLKKAGVYYWSVIAIDSKSSTSSLSGKLTCLPPDRVRIDTSVSKLPELIRCSTFVKAPIVIKNGYPPFSYTCSQPIVISGDSLVWVANCGKTGSYKINLEVKDSAGNTDSYTFNTSIYGSDSLGLMIVNNVLRNDKKEITISRSQGKTVVCTLAIIDPDPSPPEKFVIDVFLGNIQQQYFNNYVGRTFSVSLKPSITKTYDTLRVNVQDMDNHKKTLTEVIYYGD